MNLTATVYPNSWQCLTAYFQNKRLKNKSTWTENLNCWEAQHTKPSKAIHPPRDMFSSHSTCDVICKVVAILSDEVVGIPMVLRSHALNKCPKFRGRHFHTAQWDGTSEDKTWAALRFHFKYSTYGEVMGSKSIFHSVYWENRLLCVRCRTKIAKT